jgi:hypothetical protein
MSKILKSFTISDIVYDADRQKTTYTFFQGKDGKGKLSRVMMGENDSDKIAEDIADIIKQYYC